MFICPEYYFSRDNPFWIKFFDLNEIAFYLTKQAEKNLTMTSRLGVCWGFAQRAGKLFTVSLKPHDKLHYLLNFSTFVGGVAYRVSQTVR